MHSQEELSLLLVWRFGGLCFIRGRFSGFYVEFFLTWHSHEREKVKHLVVVDQMDALGAEADEVRAVFATVFAHAVIHAEKIGVGAIHALSKGHADLRHYDVTGRANREQVFADDVVLAAFQGCVAFDEAEYPASHVDVRVGAVVFLDLLKTLVHPVDAVSAINHVIRSSSGAPPNV